MLSKLITELVADLPGMTGDMGMSEGDSGGGQLSKVSGKQGKLGGGGVMADRDLVLPERPAASGQTIIIGDNWDGKWYRMLDDPGQTPGHPQQFTGEGSVTEEYRKLLRPLHYEKDLSGVISILVPQTADKPSAEAARMDRPPLPASHGQALP